MFFEWDKTKAGLNLLKHGVSFNEASTAFWDDRSVTIEDPLHSGNEERLVLIGCSHRRGVLVVVHILRGQKIRLISARKATKREREIYEKNAT